MMAFGIMWAPRIIKFLMIPMAIIILFEVTDMIWSIIHNHEYINKDKYIREEALMPWNSDNNYQNKNLELLKSINNHLKIIEYTLLKGRHNHEN